MALKAYNPMKKFVNMRSTVAFTFEDGDGNQHGLDSGQYSIDVSGMKEIKITDTVTVTFSQVPFFFNGSSKSFLGTDTIRPGASLVEGDRMLPGQIYIFGTTLFLVVTEHLIDSGPIENRILEGWAYGRLITINEPVGNISFDCNEGVLPGYRECDGSILSAGESLLYPMLYVMLGTSFGAQGQLPNMYSKTPCHYGSVIPADGTPDTLAWGSTLGDKFGVKFKIKLT